MTEMTKILDMKKTIFNRNSEHVATFEFGLVPFKGQRTRCRTTVYVYFRYDKNGRPMFSASARVVCGRSYVMGGQCLDDIYRDSYIMQCNPIFNIIYGLWKRNHLNNIHAAVNEEQQKLVDEFIANGNDYDYYKICDYLKSIGKLSYVIDGEICSYGKNWYYWPISTEDMESINEIFELDEH